MDEFKSVEELLDLAVERELDAQALYSFLAEKVRDQEVADMLLEFRDEEKEHQRRIEMELIKLGHVVRQGDREDRHIDFAEGSKGGVEFDMDFPAALMLAMNKERAAFRLYIELASMTSKNEFREVLMELAEQEAMHLVRFEVLYNQVSRPNKD
jgi:rubrerythrin